MDIDFSAFRKNLKSLIDGRGLLMKDVAADIGVSPSTLSRYLSADRYPDLKYVIRLAEYFNVSFDWLLGINGEKFEMLPQDIQEIGTLYAIASDDDRRVVQAVLNKYREDNWKVSHKMADDDE